MAFLGGLHYWWPKIWGRMYNETLGKIAAGIIFVGFNMTFFSQFMLGMEGMPRRYYTYLDQYQPLHGFSSVGSLVMAVGFFLMGFYLIHSIFRGKKATSNPWGALTFEWQISSPPSQHNFEPIRPAIYNFFRFVRPSVAELPAGWSWRDKQLKDSGFIPDIQLDMDISPGAMESLEGAPVSQYFRIVVETLTGDFECYGSEGF